MTKKINGDWRKSKTKLKPDALRSSILAILKRYRFGRTLRQLADELEVEPSKVQHRLRVLCEHHKVRKIRTADDQRTDSISVWGIWKKADVRRRLQTQRNRKRIRKESFAGRSHREVSTWP